MIEHVPTSRPGTARDQYDLDAMMDALIQGRADWVYQHTRPAAEAGSPKAQLMMGILHQIGSGVSQSGREAVRFYRMAADQGDGVAWRNLGTLYLLGLAGIEVDKSEAHRCFLRAKMIETEQQAKELLTHEIVQ